MNLFPQLTEEQKRNTYKLPLNANQVKANKEIEYSHWDAESQCAEAVHRIKLHGTKAIPACQSFYIDQQY
jgi:hypothetical protein